MDNVVAESQDTMINSLNFGLPETSQYITDRRFANYFPSGSNVYNPNAGNKNIRFYFSGEDNTYLGLSSVRLFATLQNTDGTRNHFLRPLGGLHAFMNRYRCTVGGQLCQDIIEYNKHCELYDCFKPRDVRDMDDIESSANPRWDADFHDYANGLDVLLQATTDGATSGAGVVTVNTAGDKNEWGRVDKRYTRHSLTGIPGAASTRTNAAQLFLLARARSRVSHAGETVRRPSEAEKLLALLLATHLSQKHWPLSQNSSRTSETHT